MHKYTFLFTVLTLHSTCVHGAAATTALVSPPAQQAEVGKLAQYRCQYKWLGITPRLSKLSEKVHAAHYLGRTHYPLWSTAATAATPKPPVAVLQQKIKSEKQQAAEATMAYVQYLASNSNTLLFSTWQANSDSVHQNARRYEFYFAMAEVQYDGKENLIPLYCEQLDNNGQPVRGSSALVWWFEKKLAWKYAQTPWRAAQALQKNLETDKSLAKFNFDRLVGKGLTSYPQ